MADSRARSIKGYELLECISENELGVVYRAIQTAVKREVAIKIISLNYINDPSFIRQFEKEAQVIARLEHPHIVPLYDYWRDPSGAYLVMRFLQGGDLWHAVQRGPFSLHAAALLLEQVGSGLTLAHSKHIVHGNIKSANILLDEDKNSYLADFGIAQSLTRPLAKIVQTDAVTDLLHYIAPEQARHEAVTPATDIYSLGIVLYEILAGHHPFPRGSSVDRLYKQLNDPLPAIDSLAGKVGERVNAIIQKATAKNPEQRYANVPDMLLDFRQAVGLDEHKREMGDGVNLVSQLTPREQEVLKLMRDGLSNNDIAERLVITVGTVKWYNTQIYRKLHVRGRVQAIVKARELDLIVDEQWDNTAVSAAAIYLTRPENPYKGLEAFEPADSQDFFGREELVTRLLKRMREPGPFARFLAIIGPSGTGKSSLVQAGLIPALWSGKLPDSASWFVISMLPGARPLDELEVALARLASTEAATFLSEYLRRDAAGLLRAANLILPDDGSELVLIIDQFEELFTLVDDEAVRLRFIDLLSTAVTNTRSRVRVVITLRADFYDRPLHYAEFGEMVRSRMETLLPLSTSALERAIVKPAERVGVAFEEGLVTSIIAELDYHAGTLPLLQYSLTELFDRQEERTLTQQAYREMGGAVGALAQRAEEAYAELDQEAQELVRQMFLRLVTLGEGTEDARRRVSLQELLSISEQHQEIDDLIELFAAYRLLVLDHDPASRQPTVEVAHEAILREWERLRMWLNESRADIRRHRGLLFAAEEWQRFAEDSSYLLRGSRLADYTSWMERTTFALTPAERNFLATSISENQRQEETERLRQQRELQLERRSRRALVVLVAVLLVAMIGAVGVALFAINERNRTQDALDVAERQANVNHSLVLASDAEQESNSGYTDLALRLALEAVNMDDPPARSVQTLQSLARKPGMRAMLNGHSARVSALSLSPAGEEALTGSCAQMTAEQGCAQGELILWHIGGSASDAREIMHFGHEQSGWITAVEFNPQGNHTALSAADDGSIILWDTTTGELLKRFTGQGASSIAFHPGGDQFLASSTDGSISLWDINSGSLLTRWQGDQENITTVAYAPGGEAAISSAADGSIWLWDTDSGTVIRQFENEYSVTSAAFGPDGRTVWGLTQGFATLVWDVASGDLLEEIPNTGQFTDLAFTPDGRFAIFGEEVYVLVWNIARKRIEYHLRNSSTSSFITAVSVTADGSRIVSGSEDGRVQVWNLELAEDQRVLTVPDAHSLQNAQLGGDGQQLLTDAKGQLVLVDLATGQITRQIGQRLPGETAPGALGLSPDGRLIVAGGGNWEAAIGTPEAPWLLVLDADSGEVVHKLEGHQFNVRAVAISPDSRYALSGSMANTAGPDYMGMGELLLWDLRTGELLRRLDYDRSVGGIAFSEDGTVAATCSPHPHTANVTLWAMPAGTAVREFTGNAFGALDVTFGPHDGQLLMSATNGKIILFDLASGETIREFSGQDIPSYDVAIDPLGQYVVSGPIGGAFLWDFESGEELRHVEMPEAITTSAVFPTDQEAAYLVAGGTNLLLEWPLRRLSLPELREWVFQNRYIGPFSCEERRRYNIDPPCESE